MSFSFYIFRNTMEMIHRQCLFTIVLLTLIYPSSGSISPSEILRITQGFTQVYDAVLLNNATQIIVSCRLETGSAAIRRYLINGTGYVMSGQFQLQMIDGNYDYLVVAGDKLVSGSKMLGIMKFWNLTTSQYMFQLNNTVYISKILYHQALQMLFFTLRGTNQYAKCLSMVNLTINQPIRIIYYLADDLSVSSSGYVALFSQVNSSTINIIKYTTYAVFVGSCTSMYRGDRNVHWVENETGLLVATSLVDPLNGGTTVMVEACNLTAVIAGYLLRSTSNGGSLMNGISSPTAAGGTTTTSTSTGTTSTSTTSPTNTGSTTTTTTTTTTTGTLITSLSGTQSYSLYLSTFKQLFLPYSNSLNQSILSQITYPLPARLLQSNFQFKLIFTSRAIFVYEATQNFFGVIVGGMFYLYRFYTICPDYTYYDQQTMTCLNCIANCRVCSVSGFCDSCDSGYTNNVTSCYMPVVVPIVTPIVTPNITPTSNNTSTSNTQTTTNNTQTNNTTTENSNTTNLDIQIISIDNFTDPIDIIILDNSTLNNQTFIDNFPSNSTYLAWLRQLFFNSLLKMLNKVPASRKVLKPIFRFFVNIDDLWIYYYHRRQYCNVTLEVFQSIQNFQNEKWELVHFSAISQVISWEQDRIEQYFSYMEKPSEKDNFLKIQKKNSGYFVNTLDFNFSNLILIILTFFTLHLTQHLTRNLFISIFLKQYSFYIYLGIMIMQGNTQYFTYLIFNQFQMLSNQHPLHKLSHIYAILTYFIMFTFCAICYIVMFCEYKEKQAKYFFENFKVTKAGAVGLFGIFFVKNFVLGLVHSYFNYDYQFKIFLLLALEIVFLVINVSIIVNKTILNKTSQWVIVYCALDRIMLIFTFYLDYRLKSNFAQLQSIQQILFTTYLAIGLFSLCFQSISFCYQLWSTYRKYSQFKRMIQNPPKQTLFEVTIKKSYFGKKKNQILSPNHSQITAISQKPKSQAKLQTLLEQNNIIIHTKTESKPFRKMKFKRLPLKKNQLLCQIQK